MAGNQRKARSFSYRGQLSTSRHLNTSTANVRCAAALVCTLHRCGLQHVVVSSGSRSTPLVLAVARQRGLQIWTNPDERSAAFTALGMAKALRQPAALICTSGTAAANYYPALIEARMSGTPLVVITADRPPRLRGVGAPQTIDQVGLYASYPVYERDLPLPGSGEDAATWAAIADEAYARSLEGRGPVHLNAPFDEPLVPDPAEVNPIIEAAQLEFAPGGAPTRIPKSAPISSAWIDSLASILAEAERPVIVSGPDNEEGGFSELVGELADRIGAPVLADIASSTRGLASAIGHYDMILRDAVAADALKPDVVLRIGGLPTSKSLNEWIARPTARAKIGLHHGIVADPYGCLTDSLTCDLGNALQSVIAALGAGTQPSPYRERWLLADAMVGRAIDLHNDSSSQILEATLVASVCDCTDPDTILFLSSSMPIRWADMYIAAGSRLPRVLVNRGANGIDGIISTAAGAAVATGRTTICVLGDLAFLHDQNGLWSLVARNVPLKIIVLNNDGGGVFHYLPIAAHDSVFEPLVAMPHGIDLACLALAHGISYHRVATKDGFVHVLRECLKRPGPEVIEVRTDRYANAEWHQQMIEQAIRAGRSTLGIDA